VFINKCYSAVFYFLILFLMSRLFQSQSYFRASSTETFNKKANLLIVQPFFLHDFFNMPGCIFSNL